MHGHVVGLVNKYFRSFSNSRPLMVIDTLTNMHLTLWYLYPWILNTLSIMIMSAFRDGQYFKMDKRKIQS